MVLLDVSQPVTPATAAWPGDEPFSCGWTMEMARGAPVNVGWTRGSPHVGTHVDAPYHFVEGGARAGDLPLDAFLGSALVVDAVGRGALDADLFAPLDLRGTPRVLVRTAARSDWRAFRPDFPLLTPDAVRLLADAGVRLVGLDAPSFDGVDSKDLPVHHALARAGIVNVENLLLDDAPPGRYELLAAPVRWAEMDAAPLRAVLRR